MCLSFHQLFCYVRVCHKLVQVHLLLILLGLNKWGWSIDSLKDTTLRSLPRNCCKCGPVSSQSIWSTRRIRKWASKSCSRFFSKWASWKRNGSPNSQNGESRKSAKGTWWCCTCGRCLRDRRMGLLRWTICAFLCWPSKTSIYRRSNSWTTTSACTGARLASSTKRVTCV